MGMHTQHRKLIFYLNGDYDCVAGHKYNNVFLVITWRHDDHDDAPKQRNGGHLITRKLSLLFRSKNMAADHVKENQQYTVKDTCTTYHQDQTMKSNHMSPELGQR